MFGNPNDLEYAEKSELEIAEGCKRLNLLELPLFDARNCNGKDR